MEFNKNILNINCDEELTKISNFIKKNIESMKKQGIVVGLSGGIDSALTAALSVEAIGKKYVLGLILPEKDSNQKSEIYAEKEAERLGIDTIRIDITPILNSFGTYDKRDRIIRKIFPEYNEKCKFKIMLPKNLLKQDMVNFFTIIVEDNDGNKKTARLKIKQLNGIIAATDTKQRMRMMQLYYYAELKNYLVCGTTNKSEVIQGFFVKYGDGGVDIEPIAHLYKSQVYQLAKHLGISEEIIKRKPSPDTFSSIVSDEEFYFRIDYNQLDYLLYAWENKIQITKVSEMMNLKIEQIQRAFRDFNSKFKATKHLRQLPPTLDS